MNEKLMEHLWPDPAKRSMAKTVFESHGTIRAQQLVIEALKEENSELRKDIESLHARIRDLKHRFNTAWNNAVEENARIMEMTSFLEAIEVELLERDIVE